MKSPAVTMCLPVHIGACVLLLVLRTATAVVVKPEHVEASPKTSFLGFLKEGSAFLSKAKHRAQRGGPATLEEYCKGEATTTLSTDTKVEADWKGYGMYYPGRVTKSEDGKVTIHYDDGFDETIEDEDGDGEFSRVHPIEGETTQKVQPRDDAACEMKEFVDKVKEKVVKISDDISKFVAGKRAQKAGKKPPAQVATQPPVAAGAPAPAVAASPSSVPMDATEDQKSELEKLIEELRAVDAEIQEVGGRVAANDQLLGQGRDKGPMSVDDLIAMYRARLAERKEELARLKAREEQQEQELAAAGFNPITLASIKAPFEELEEDLKKVKIKRDALEAKGKLDQELGHLVDGLLETGKNLRDKVTALFAAEDAAEKAEKDPSGKEAQAADDAVLAAAESFEEDLKKMDKSTDTLEHDLHPHGEKWWRYRYEHSFVEAMLMVLVTILMVFWEKVVLKMKHYSYTNYAKMIAHGTMRVHWMENFALELMACLLTFLTVWALAQSYFFELLPMVLEQSADLHLPTTGAEYRVLALDICGILFTAILFYYMLAFAIVRASMNAIEAWATTEVLSGRKKSSASGPARSTSIVQTGELNEMHSYFSAAFASSEDMKDILSERGITLGSFPFWKYLRVAVRGCLDGMTVFGAWMWLMITLTFACLMCLHYFFHMGYVRITIFALLCLGVTSVLMIYLVTSINRRLEHASQGDATVHAKTVSSMAILRVIVPAFMQYNLFFLCYAFTRVACQSWMWELHFWPVLGITIFTFFFSLFFVFILAPMIPMFASAMALPPYVDIKDEAFKDILDVMEKMESPEEYLDPSSPSSRNKVLS